jgi:hypothetical protein
MKRAGRKGEGGRERGLGVWAEEKEGGEVEPMVYRRHKSQADRKKGGRRNGKLK